MNATQASTFFQFPQIEGSLTQLISVETTFLLEPLRREFVRYQLVRQNPAPNIIASGWRCHLYST
jgi:hypothetical protein